ncbi:HEAT repeat domain-containing protein, partial [Halorubrum pallidum]
MAGSDSGDAERDSGGRDTQSGERSENTRPEAFALLDERTDPATRKEAVEALGNPSSSMATSEREIADRLLRVALTDDDAGVRAEAIDSLYFHGDRYLDELVQQVAARLHQRESGTGRDPEELFARWLTSEFGEYRMVGATGLASVGTERSIAVVRDAFDDGDPRVQARSVRAYAEL